MDKPATPVATQGYVLCDLFRIVSVAVQEIGVHRQRCCVHDLANVREHFIARHAAVFQTARESKARRSGGERFETEVAQI